MSIHLISQLSLVLLASEVRFSFLFCLITNFQIEVLLSIYNLILLEHEASLKREDAAKILELILNYLKSAKESDPGRFYSINELIDLLNLNEFPNSSITLQTIGM